MFKSTLISTLCLLSASIGVAADNNMFIYSYNVQPTQTAPAPEPTGALEEDSSSQFTNFHGYDFWHVGKEEHPVDTGGNTAGNGSDGEIVTAGTTPPPRPSEPQSPPPQLEFPDTPPVPMPRPERPSTPAPQSPTVNDIPNCRYGANCWRGKGLSQQIQKIVSNVEHINSLHKAKLDPRYLVCTGWRESTFNPGAVGAQKEKGMFQIMPATGRAALGYGPKVLPKSGYMDKMVKSTLAQTELSFLTLKMKVAEGASARTLNGNGSVQDYRNLARRYNGAGPAAERYANAVASCFDCMRRSFPSIKGSTPVNESKARQCLNKAKH